MNQNEIEWGDQSEFPGELNGNTGFSVDVLIYSKQMDEHSIAWYDFKIMEWKFLCREPHKKFKWRYFDDKIDKK